MSKIRETVIFDFRPWSKTHRVLAKSQQRKAENLGEQRKISENTLQSLRKAKNLGDYQKLPLGSVGRKRQRAGSFL